MGRGGRTFDGQQAYEKWLSLIIRQIQIKMAIRYHLISIRMSHIKMNENCFGGEHLSKRSLI